METKLTGQGRLKIISEMIKQAKTNIQKESTDTIIFVGYCVALIAILNFIFLSFSISNVYDILKLIIY